MRAGLFYTNCLQRMWKNLEHLGSSTLIFLLILLACPHGALGILNSWGFILKNPIFLISYYFNQYKLHLATNLVSFPFNLLFPTNICCVQIKPQRNVFSLNAWYVCRCTTPNQTPSKAGQRCSLQGTEGNRMFSSLPGLCSTSLTCLFCHSPFLFCYSATRLCHLTYSYTFHLAFMSVLDIYKCLKKKEKA